MSKLSNHMRSIENRRIRKAFRQGNEKVVSAYEKRLERRFSWEMFKHSGTGRALHLIGFTTAIGFATNFLSSIGAERPQQTGYHGDYSPNECPLTETENENGMVTTTGNGSDKVQ